jgi:Tol biopolymer transport system component
MGVGATPAACQCFSSGGSPFANASPAMATASVAAVGSDGAPEVRPFRHSGAVVGPGPSAYAYSMRTADRHRRFMAGSIATALLVPTILGASATTAGAAPGDTTLISRQSDAAGGAGANEISYSLSEAVSADGRRVVFETAATNLSDVDRELVSDVFVRDTIAGTTTLVSRRSASKGGAAANDHSFAPAISANGRFVAFESEATNLTGRRGGRGVYLRDLKREKTVLVAPKANGPSISGSGRYVAFIRQRRDGSEVAVARDVKRGRSELVSRRSDGGGGDRGKGRVDAVSISNSCRYVAFESSASNLSRKDGKGDDIFRRDRRTDQTRLVSLQSRSRGGNGANRRSRAPEISADGHRVVFESAATNLSRADSTAVDDVYMRDLNRQTTELISRRSAGDGGAVQDPVRPDNPVVLGLRPVVSNGGRYVAFQSTAANLSDEDVDGLIDNEDVFVRDVRARTTELVSRASDSEGGTPGNEDSYNPSITDDGRFLAFTSGAGNLTDDDNPSAGFADVFLRQLR